MKPTHQLLVDTKETYTNNDGKETTRLKQFGIIFPGQDHQDTAFTASGSASSFPVALFTPDNKLSLFYNDPDKDSKRPTHSLKVEGREYQVDGKTKHEYHEFLALWASNKNEDTAKTFTGYGRITEIPVQLMDPDNRVLIVPIKPKDDS